MTTLDNVCNNCGTKGSLTFDHGNQTWRCSRCHFSNPQLLKPTPKAVKVKEEEMQASEEGVITNGIPQSVNPRDVTTEEVRYTSTDGRVHKRDVARFFLPLTDHAPDLTINSLSAGRVKWTLEHEGVIESEREYGRKWLEDRRYVERTIKVFGYAGRAVTAQVMVPPELAELSDDELRAKLVALVKQAGETV